MRGPGAVLRAETGARSPARPGVDFPALRRRAGRWRVPRIAGAVLAAVVLVAVGWREAPLVRFASGAGDGTALLGTTTCSDWREYSSSRRMDVIATLGIAATSPDPESRGATLEAGAAYSLFQRACSTRASSSSLLYEVYNRAASFQPAAVAAAVRLGGFGTAAHR